MLTKEDYLDYLRQMMDIENDMKVIYHKCARAVDDSNLKKIFSQLERDETSHGDGIEEVIKTIAAKSFI